MSAVPDEVMKYVAAEKDDDPQETGEWLEALDGVISAVGPDRAHYLIEKQIEFARVHGEHLPFSANTPYINTIPVWVFEHKRPQPVILVFEALDDPRPVLHASGGWVVGLQGQMQLILVAFQNHEADRVSVFEGFRKPLEPLGKVRDQHLSHRTDQRRLTRTRR